MNEICPNCKASINMTREKLIDCPKCKSKVLLVTINGEKKLIDVTPREDLKK